MWPCRATEYTWIGVGRPALTLRTTRTVRVVATLAAVDIRLGRAGQVAEWSAMDTRVTQFHTKLQTRILH